MTRIVSLGPVFWATRYLPHPLRPAESQQPQFRHSKVPAGTVFRLSTGPLGSKLTNLMSIYVFVSHILSQRCWSPEAPGGLSVL